MTDGADITEIKLAISDIKGEMRTMTEMMRSGDRDAASGVKLLAGTVDSLARSLSESRVDLKEAVTKFDERTEALRRKSESDVSAVRVSLEGQLRGHAEGEAPHDKTIGTRLDSMEKKVNQAFGAVAILAFIGLPGIYAILKAAGQ